MFPDSQESWNFVYKHFEVFSFSKISEVCNYCINNHFHLLTALLVLLMLKSFPVQIPIFLFWYYSFNVFSKESPFFCHTDFDMTNVGYRSILWTITQQLSIKTMDQWHNIHFSLFQIFSYNIICQGVSYYFSTPSIGN